MIKNCFVKIFIFKLLCIILWQIPRIIRIMTFLTIYFGCQVVGGIRFCLSSSQDFHGPECRPGPFSLNLINLKAGSIMAGCTLYGLMGSRMFVAIPVCLSEFNFCMASCILAVGCNGMWLMTISAVITGMDQRSHIDLVSQRFSVCMALLTQLLGCRLRFVVIR